MKKPAGDRVTEGRKFIRHPSNLPAELRRNAVARPDAVHLENISDGGLAFSSKVSYSPGEEIAIAFPHLAGSKPVRGTIRWACKARPPSSRTLYGVQVGARDAKRHTAVVEKICHIEVWREVQQYLRKKKISSAEAAEEWIRQYDRSFPK